MVISAKGELGVFDPQGLHPCFDCSNILLGFRLQSLGLLVQQDGDATLPSIFIAEGPKQRTFPYAGESPRITSISLPSRRSSATRHQLQSRLVWMPFLLKAGYYLVPTSALFRGKQESCGAARYGSADKGGKCMSVLSLYSRFRFRYVFPPGPRFVNELIELVF